MILSKQSAQDIRDAMGVESVDAQIERMRFRQMPPQVFHVRPKKVVSHDKNGDFVTAKMKDGKP